MNVNKISKLFVEQDEEIVFIIENVLEAPNDRVILVIPHVSALTSSAVSLKSLSKQIVKSSKLVVLVCDNANARHLSSKANLTIREKMSEVDKNAWMEAKSLKDRILDDNDKIKHELLGARTPVDEVKEITQGVVSAKLVDEKIEEEIPITEKPRLKPKVIDINGVKFVMGGDIADTPDLLDIERRRVNDEEISEEEIEKENTIINEQDLIGTDYSSGKSKMASFKKSLPKFKLGMPKFLSKLSSGTSKKIFLGLLGVLVLYVVVVYYAFSDVYFVVYLEKTTQAIKKTITADSTAVQIIPDKFTITAEIFTKSGTLKSDAQPTGKGKKGNPSTGEVTIMNKKTVALTLPAGTVLTEQKTGKGYKYLTTIVLTVPAATTPSELGKVTTIVNAETFGEEYVMNAYVNYKVGSYLDTDVTAFSVDTFTPSPVTETLVVSKEDIDAVKATLSDQLKFELSNQLKSLLATDDILLTGSEKYTEDTFTTTAKLGDEIIPPTPSDTPKFEAELKLTVTALIISKSDLRTIAEEIIKLEHQQDNQSVVVTLNDPIMEDVKIDGTKATFELRTNATIIAEMDSNNLEQLILGKSVDEAKTILSNFNGVKEVRAKYNPPFIPYSIQMVPDDPARVSVSTTEYRD